MKQAQAAQTHYTKYREIYNILKAAIQDGMYLSGALLPTEMQLMNQYQVSRTTVRRAISMLQADGLIEVVQGRGAEVVQGRTKTNKPSFAPPYEVSRVEKRGWDEGKVSFSSSIVDTMQADDRVAEKLHVMPLSNVYRVQRLKFCDEVPFGYVVSYLSCSAVPDLEQFSGKVMWLSKHLHDYYHVDPLSANEVVLAKAATFLESNFLRVPVGHPLMLVQRTAYYEKNVVEFSESFHNPAYFYISFELEGRPDYLRTEDPSVI